MINPVASSLWNIGLTRFERTRTIRLFLRRPNGGAIPLPKPNPGSNSFKNLSSGDGDKARVPHKHEGPKQEPEAAAEGKPPQHQGNPTVHSLKRAFRRNECDNREESDQSFQRVYDSKFERLLRLDMIAVLRELRRQNQCQLVLKVDLLYKYFREEENLKPELETVNTLLRTLVSSGLAEQAVGCYRLMNDIGCDPDRETYRILINGLDAFGPGATFAHIREDAIKCYGNLDFLQEHEEKAHPIRKLVSGRK